MILSEDKTQLLTIEAKDVDAGGTLRVPEGVTHIGYEAIKEDKQRLKTVICPSTLEEVGIKAFAECSHLTSFLLKKPEMLQRIMSNAFDGCKELRAFQFEKTTSLNLIGTSAFRDTGLTHIDFGSYGPSHIQANAFSYCKNSMWANLGTRLEYLGDFALSNNDLLTKIEIPSENMRIVENYVFSNCPRLEVFSCYSYPQNIMHKSFDGVNFQKLKTKKHSYFLPEISTEIIQMFLKEGNDEE